LSHNDRCFTTAAINYGGAIECPDAERVCAGQPADPTWPAITFISPDTGYPGDSITIFGTNFVNITTVYIAGYCTNVDVISPTQLTAILPTYENILNPSNFLKAKADVIVGNVYGHNDLRYKLYNLEIALNADLAKAALKWVKEYWYIVVIAGCVLAVLILIIYCCCCKSKNKERRRNGLV